MTLSDILEQSAKQSLTPLPQELKSGWNIGKVYAEIEAKLEEERYELAKKKRAEKGVSYAQLQDLKAKVERSFIDIPIAEKRLEKSKKLYEELGENYQNEADEKLKSELKSKGIKAKSAYDSAFKSLQDKIKIRDNYTQVLTTCGVFQGGNS